MNDFIYLFISLSSEGKNRNNHDWNLFPRDWRCWIFLFRHWFGNVEAKKRRFGNSSHPRSSVSVFPSFFLSFFRRSFFPFSLSLSLSSLSHPFRAGKRTKERTNGEGKVVLEGSFSVARDVVGEQSLHLGLSRSVSLSLSLAVCLLLGLFESEKLKKRGSLASTNLRIEFFGAQFHLLCPGSSCSYRW